METACVVIATEEDATATGPYPAATAGSAAISCGYMSHSSKQSTSHSDTQQTLTDTHTAACHYIPSCNSAISSASL